MEIIDSLKEREKDLGKPYNTWSDYEKVKYILDYDINVLNSQISETINHLDNSVEELQQNSDILISSPKLEKFVSAQELINFIEKDYIQNVWNTIVYPLGKLLPMDPRFDKYSEYYLFSEVKLKKEKDHANGELDYCWDGSNQLHRNYQFSILNKNGSYCFVSNDMSVDVLQKINQAIDFSVVYNYYINEMYANASYSLNGIYIYDDRGINVLNVPITFNNQSITIGTDSFLMKFFIKQNKMESSEHSNNLNEVNPLSILYLTDSKLLDNLKIRYDELPSYVQDRIFKYNNKGIQKTKNIFRKFFTK